MLEKDFQKDLITELKNLFDGCIVLKNDEQYIQGIPDLTLLYENKWAFIEVKKSYFERYRPNQEYYLDKADAMSMGVMICPENKEEVLNQMARIWGVRK